MKYSQSYAKTFKDVTPQQIWAIWSDINKRHIWDDDTEWAKLEGKFEVGNSFWFKPKGGPKLRMYITECTPNRSFTDTFNLPFAKLQGIHELKESAEGLIITTTMQTTGVLRWLWQRLLTNKIIATLPQQTELLVQAAKQNDY